DAALPAIIGNETDILVYKKISPLPGAPAVRWVLGYDAPLSQGTADPMTDSQSGQATSTISSTAFVYGGVLSLLADDGKGAVWVTRQGVLSIRVGVVNYASGVVQLTSFAPDSYDGSAINIYARMRDKDIVSSRSTVLAIEPAQTIVTVVP